MINIDIQDEQTIKIDGINIKYIFKSAQLDNTNLLIIFSGFGLKSDFTYDFRGKSLEGYRSNILWILDNFFDNCCYYICYKKNFHIEHAIIKFINELILQLNICKENCTLCGASKGASSALYYGIKYNFKNIIASCPQMKLGTFLKNIHPNTAIHMMDEINLESIDYFDSIIKNLLIYDKLIDKNIYLISSPVDEWETCEEYIPYFKKYKNFNHIITRSSCAWRHNKITSYNLPILQSILYSLGEGIIPKYGTVFNGIPLIKDKSWEDELQKQVQKNVCIATLSNASIKNGLFYPEGAAFIKGIESCKYGLFKKVLFFVSIEGFYSFSLGSIRNEELSKQYFENVFCDYSTGGYASPNYEGLDLSTLPLGNYKMVIKVNSPHKECQSACKYCLSKDIYGISSDGKLVRCTQDINGNAILQKFLPISTYQPNYFLVRNKWIQENLLHYEGDFIIYGIEIKNWGDCCFYLVLCNNQKCFPFFIGMHNIERLNCFFDGCGIYQKSNFSTPQRKGIDFSSLPKGEYEIFITMHYKSSVFSKNTGDVICII